MTRYRPSISTAKYLSSSSSLSSSSLSSSSISSLPAPPSDIAESAAKEEAKFAAAVNAEREAAAPLRINNNRSNQSNHKNTDDTNRSSGRSSSDDVPDDKVKGITPRQAWIIKWGDRFWNAIVVGGVVVSCYYFFQWPDGCQAVVDQSADNPLILDQVGSPIKGSYWWSGNVENDLVKVIIPISGPKGKATLDAVAVRHPATNRWYLVDCMVQLPGSPRRITIEVPPLPTAPHATTRRTVPNAPPPSPSPPQSQ